MTDYMARMGWHSDEKSNSTFSGRNTRGTSLTASVGSMDKSSSIIAQSSDGTSSHFDALPHLPDLDDESNSKSSSINNYVTDAPTNIPNETIGTPVLHSWIKRYPRVQAFMQRFYDKRWASYYPLQRRCLYTCTYGEVLLLVPYVVIALFGLLTSFHPSLRSGFSSGHLARVPLFVVLLTANRNSWITMLLGIPFERGLFYHKISGYMSLFLGFTHAFAVSVEHNGDKNMRFLFLDVTNISGTYLESLILMICLSSLPYIRRRLFEIFYFLHILFAVGCLGCAFYHSGQGLFLFGLILLASDLFFRLVYMAGLKYPKTASVRPISDSVIEISFPKTKNFDYNPGQYIFLLVPEISMFQWHPFSISSSPHQEVVTLHIRNVGYWTNRLYQIAEAGSDINILLEGPYGSLAVDLFSERYKLIMLFSGGIGVTPMQSICHQLLHEHAEKNRQLKKIWYIWSARDPILANENGSVIVNMSNHSTTRKKRAHLPIGGSLRRLNSTSLAQNALIELPRSFMPDDDLEFEIFNNDEGEAIFDVSSDPDSILWDLRQQIDRVGGSSGIVASKEADVDSSVSLAELGRRRLNERMTYANKRKSVDKAIKSSEKSLHSSGYASANNIATSRSSFGTNARSSNHTIMSNRSSIDTIPVNEIDRMLSPLDALLRGKTSDKCSVDHPDDDDTHSTGSGWMSDSEGGDKTEKYLSLVQVEFHLTGAAMKKHGVSPAIAKHVKSGRPNLGELFSQARAAAWAKNEERIAVLTCAPQPMMDALRTACMVYSGNEVTFDFHEENIGF